MEFYKVKVKIQESDKEFIEFVSAEDDIDAIDKVMKYYTEDLKRHVEDIKVV